MDRILKTPKSPSCMGCDYGLPVNILEDGEGSTGKSYNLDCAAKLNFEEFIHKTERTVHSVYKVIGGTPEHRLDFCYHRLIHINSMSMGCVKPKDAALFFSDHIYTCPGCVEPALAALHHKDLIDAYPNLTGPIRMYGMYKDDKRTAVVFSFNCSDFDEMTLDEAISLAGTKNVVDWRAGNPGNGQFGVVDCSCDWGPPKYTSHALTTTTIAVPIKIRGLTRCMFESSCQYLNEPSKYHTPSGHGQVGDTMLSGIIELTPAMTTRITKKLGLVGWDSNGHSGVFDTKCPICRKYLTEDEPREKQ